MPVDEWLWDTGAAIDIVPRSALKGMEHLIRMSTQTLQLSTAGGLCEAAEEIVLETSMLEEKAFKPAVLDSTPLRFRLVGGAWNWDMNSIGSPFLLPFSHTHPAKRSLSE